MTDGFVSLFLEISKMKGCSLNTWGEAQRSERKDMDRKVRWFPKAGQQLSEFSEDILCWEILLQCESCLTVKKFRLRIFIAFIICWPARRIRWCWRASLSACAGQRNEGEVRSRIDLSLLLENITSFFCLMRETPGVWGLAPNMKNSLEGIMRLIAIRNQALRSLEPGEASDDYIYQNIATDHISLLLMLCSR